MSKIRITGPASARAVRTSLINFLWKNEGLPSGAPTLRSGIHAGMSLRLPTLNGIKFIHDRVAKTRYPEVYEFEYKMPYGMNSLVHLCSPVKKKNNKLIIYHHGHHAHGSNIDMGERTIGYFLSNGYHVMIMHMPLTWPNNRKLNDVSYIGDTKAHNALAALETKHLCPVKFLIEPVHATLNLLDAEYKFDSYNMIGLSGGGWTTTLCAAIDDRISQSYSVAGSLPLELRDGPSFGDYEQHHQSLYKTANYQELYILGSFGSKRKCVHIYNENDPCCFSGRKYESYHSIVKKTSNRLGESTGGGYYKVYLDERNLCHSISPWALDWIRKEIEGKI